MRLITSVATLLTFVSVIQAQNPAPTTNAIPTLNTQSYPAAGANPVPKPEWLALIKSANITNAPVLESGDNGPSVSGEDKYCNWARTGCMGSSIGDCPRGVWGLTYDDGPSEFSPILYDFLKATNQRSTLFMIGSNVIKYPQLVKRAFDDGHELAIHTWTHTHMTTLTNEQVIAELKWTELAIKEITGVSPRLFRPPYGDIDDRVRDIGTALGFTSVIWDHDTNDWMLAENYPGFKSEWIDSNFTEWIAEASTATTGGLSLEHDIKKITIDAAIRNLPGLQKAYTVVTVGQCAGVPSYKESNGTHTSSAIPSATAPVVPAAPSATESHGAQNAANALGASSLIFGSFFVTLFLV